MVQAADVDGFLGPWAGYVAEENARRANAERVAAEEAARAAAVGGSGIGGASGEAATAAASAAAAAAAGGDAAAAAPEGGERKGNARDGDAAFGLAVGDGLAPADCKSTFHGKAQVDYQGRSWYARLHRYAFPVWRAHWTYALPVWRARWTYAHANARRYEPPKGLHVSDHDCIIPKKMVHKYTGHTKGVQAVQFIPVYGHLLLSASLDSRIKIWDVYNEHHCKRTYMGHTAAVRDVNFRCAGAARNGRGGCGGGARGSSRPRARRAQLDWRAVRLGVL